MYCINCGVKLGEAEQKCPLCNTTVAHPEFAPDITKALYPSDKLPKSKAGSKALCVAVIILFLIPLIVCFFADFSLDGVLSWYGYVAGALILSYIALGLPLWFKSPNPVIFVPISFVAVGLYLLYISLVTRGGWFLSFAFPVTGGIAVIVCTVVTLLRYLRRGKLYIFGGAFIALGAFMLLVEFLLGTTFSLPFIGWSIYPLSVLSLFGLFLIYLAIDSSTREMMERKLFF